MVSGPSFPERQARDSTAPRADPSSWRQTLGGMLLPLLTHAIRPAGAAEGDPMQVWAPRIVSLPSLPSQPLCGVYLCPPSAVRFCGAAPRKAVRSRSLILGDSSPTSQNSVVCTLTFCPWSSISRFMAWCIFVSGFNTHRPDSEKPGGLDLFSNVPFPHCGSKLRGEWEIRNFLGKQFAL